jgi:hypothetical protein
MWCSTEERVISSNAAGKTDIKTIARNLHGKEE